MLPEFSVIIVNHNGKKYLTECLRSVLKNSYSNYEVIVVDNGSTDGSVDFIKKEFANHLKKIKIVALDQNYGPAKARNEGVRVAKGQYLGFLDNDTQVDKNWIKEALKVFKKDPKIGCLQCKLLLADARQRFDYAGEYLGPSGFLVQRAKFREVDRGQYDQEVELLAAKSAGMFIRKDVFEKIGGFDEDYFIYLEETDLGWRSWLGGYKTLFCPRSVVYHQFGTSIKILSRKQSNFNIRFHGTKNYIMTLIKNLGTKNLVLILPRHLGVWLGFVVFLTIRGNFRSAFNVGRGIWWNAVNLPTLLSKRKKIQVTRVVTDEVLFRRVIKKQGIAEKIKEFFSSEKIVETPERVKKIT